ncbi:hypothetical protein ILUMI_13775 [Ignelater luminosus]|uniref:AMP-dependent synthetase/ligase domain-containing protein n=1 Tax=Ignelater luminosus TaxID=2038154 RepID=A0A8K0CW29_IGNLU|nr:hypothetical protein ILUMI_13775 [Ignelater luminosus]
MVARRASEFLHQCKFLVPTPEENTFIVYEVENPKETAVIVFNSGSTGLPKGACLSHYGLMGHIYQVKSHTVPRNAPVLAISNLYWISAVSLSLYFFTYGTNRIIYPNFDRDGVWNLIDKFKILGLFLNSYHALQLIKHGKPKGTDGSSVRSVLISGYSLTREQICKFKECLTNVVAFNGYGQTETSGSSLALNTNSKKDLELLMKNPHSVGRPLSGYSYKIVDPDTEEILGPNQPGELRVKSEYCMNGYYGTDSSYEWDSDGFLKSGDIAYYDEDNCFFIVDRIKDVLNYITYRVYPAHLEKILLTHPAVHNAVVIGKPDEYQGDI